jgi:Zn-dependent peptidase ImmA (M78 family)
MTDDPVVDAALAAAPPWRGEVEAFVEELAALRARPITVQAFPTAGRLFGAWLPTGRADYIFLSEQLTGAHRAHVLLHEVGHLLMDHRVGLQGSLSGVTPELAQRMLARHDYGTEQEHEAELFASLLMTGAGRSVGEWAADPRGARAATVFG